MVNAAWNEYFYPGTTVLQNIPGIRDAATLREYEYEQVIARSKDLQQHPIAGNFDLDHLKAIHKHLFQDVYEWAGQERTVNMSKGSSVFIDKDQIQAHAEYFNRNLQKDNFLIGLPKHEFAGKLAQHNADWNELHPFREGNGRATREFIGQIASQAGYTLDQKKLITISSNGILPLQRA